MRKLLWMVGMAALLVLMVPLASSQSALRATIDTPFIVGNGTELPAGEYMFIHDPGNGIMRITSTETGHSVYIATRDLDTRTDPGNDKLVLLVDGKQVVLHQIISGTVDYGRDVMHDRQYPEPK